MPILTDAYNCNRDTSVSLPAGSPMPLLDLETEVIFFFQGMLGSIYVKVFLSLI